MVAETTVISGSQGSVWRRELDCPKKRGRRNKTVSVSLRRRGVLHYCVFIRGGLRHIEASHSVPLRLTRELRGGVEQSRLRRRGDGADCPYGFSWRPPSARGVQDDPKQTISASLRRRGVACRERYRVRVRRYRSALFVATPSSRVSGVQEPSHAPPIFLGRGIRATCRSR